MSNIDKHAVQTVADLKAGYTLGHADVAILNELARIALASLEAEPVYQFWNVKTHEWVECDKETYDSWSYLHAQRRVLYTAPPVPASVPTFDEWLEIRGNKPLGWVKDAMRESYDACRAAMLQGGNSPVIPDGLRLALSNAGIAAPESDEMLAATCEKHIQALVTWVKERKPFQPAAPQQEVKNG